MRLIGGSIFIQNMQNMEALQPVKLDCQANPPHGDPIKYADKRVNSSKTAHLSAQASATCYIRTSTCPSVPQSLSPSTASGRRVV